MTDSDFPLPIGGMDGPVEIDESASQPTPVLAMPDIERVATGFVHCLRTGGISVPVSMSLRFAQALALVDIGNGEDVYWAGRTTLLSRPEDIAMYDAMFLAFFHRSGKGFKVRFEDEAESASLATDEGEGDDDGSGAGDDDVLALRYSASETLNEKDFAEFTKAELVEAQRVMANMRLRPSVRRSRRRVPLAGGDRNDLRRTVRAAMRTGGEPVVLRRTTSARGRGG